MNYHEYQLNEAIRLRRIEKKKRKKRAVRLTVFLLVCCITATAFYFIKPKNMDDSSGNQNSISQTSDSDIIRQLRELAKSNHQIDNIIEHIGDYPDELIQLLIRNPETATFVLHYPEKKDSMAAVTLSNDETNGIIPSFLQWDERWGYQKYGSDMIALAGCGPTCLSMVVVGLTGDNSANPKKIADYSVSKGYCVPDNGTDWELFMKGARHYGLSAKEVPLWESSIASELQQGHPVICCVGPGVFTTTGHFIVLTGYENGKFTVHDPNSRERSNKTWSYNEIKDQIKNLWAYSKS